MSHHSSDRLTIEAQARSEQLDARIGELCDGLEQIYERNCYPKVTVTRHWSEHNPAISGEIARPKHQ